MDPAAPRPEPLTAGVVKAISSHDQNAKRGEEQRSVAAISSRAPGEAHMAGKKHSYQHQSRHRRGAVNLHRPRLRAHLKIARRRDQIIPISPRGAAEKKQREHAVKQASL